MTRVVPKEGAVISGEFIPGGVSRLNILSDIHALNDAQSVLGMSNIFVHWNEDIFPDARAFKPERWIDPESNLDPWLVSFSKGPRSCPGIKQAVSSCLHWMRC